MSNTVGEASLDYDTYENWEPLSSMVGSLDASVTFWPGLIDTTPGEPDITKKRVITKLFTHRERQISPGLVEATSKIHSKWNSKQNTRLVSLLPGGEVDLYSNDIRRPIGAPTSFTFDEYQNEVMHQILTELDNLRVEDTNFALAGELKFKSDATNGEDTIVVTELISGQELTVSKAKFDMQSRVE